MADDSKERVPADPAAVNLREAWEVTYWCRKFGRTRLELELAIKETGSVIVDDIEAYFDRRNAAAGGLEDSR
jgi:hypothetical protein